MAATLAVRVAATVAAGRAATVADAGAPAAEPEPTVQRIEIVTSEARRRAHDPELRARLVAEMAMPGARVADLARRYGVGENLLYRWRRAARQAAERSGMLAVRLASGLAPAPVEVVLRNGRVLRVGAGADLALVARLAQALET